MSDSVFECQNLSKSYSSIQAVKALSIRIPKGSVYGILGPNGSGKTTTLGMALGVVRPTSGSLHWFNKSASSFSRRKIGSLLERPRFYPWMNAVSNLKLTATIRGVSFEGISEVLEQVGLGERKNDSVGTYSLGMTQRLSLAATLLGDPEVLVLDEPTNGIDAQGIVEVREIIQAENQKGKTIVLASHILDEVEKVCSHVAVLKQGQLIAEGAIQQVLGGKPWIELDCQNSSELEALLKSHPQIDELIFEKGRWQASFQRPVTGEEVNRFCFDHGVALSHLQMKRQSLEETFLKMVDSK